MSVYLDSDDRVRHYSIPWSDKAKSRLGQCYELSTAKVALAWLDPEYDGPRDDVHLVHGTIESYGLPPIGHGWAIRVDADGEVVEAWEPITDTWYDIRDFEALFSPVVHRVYSRIEASRAAVKSGHYGPWDV